MQIPPPSNTFSIPDSATKKGMNDFTGTVADNRVLHINLWVFKYGTSDRTHAAALVLSLLLFATIVGVLIFGHGGDWAKEAFRWLGSSFLFVSGVALGKGGNEATGSSGD